MYKNEKIEVKVTPHSHTMKYYKIEYRPKRKFNLFNFWRTLIKVWDSVYLNYDQPILFEKFDSAVEFAQKLKANPELIDKHYEEEDKKYKEAEERRNNYYESRNKTKIL